MKETHHVGNAVSNGELSMARGALKVSFNDVHVLEHGPEGSQELWVVFCICGQSFGD